MGPVMRLAGKTALVVGGGGGIGSAIAAGLAAEGAATTVADHAAPDAGEILPLDATDPRAVAALVEAVAQHHGGLDVLVYAAGRSSQAHALDLSPEEWEDVLRVNLSGAFYCALAAARVMAKGRGGSIILVSSQLAEVARPRGAAYVASKGGMRSLAQALAVDLAPHGVRVNCLGPGVTLTPMTAARYEDPAVRATWEARIPLGRVAQPRDMVGAALFLASDESAYVTGTSLYVDGGYLAL